MGAVHTAQELKGLQTQLEKAKAEEQSARTEVANSQRKQSTLAQTVRSLQSRIEQLTAKAPEPTVSEHAMLRWLERAKGIDMAAVRAEILGEGTADAIAFAGTGRIKKGGTDFTLIVQNGVVVTVKGPSR